MRHSLAATVLSLALLLAAMPPRAVAQIVVIDDVILLTSRQKKGQQARAHQHLQVPGGEYRMSSPGADVPRLGEERITVATVPGLFSERLMQASRNDARLRLGPLPTFRSEAIPLYGPLELQEEDEGPPDGLTLDAAIDRLVEASYDLAVKRQDIPKARADILTAGLRNNPLLFFSASNLPYQPYSPQRPGADNYDLTLIQPIDVSGKHQSAIAVAQQARNVLEAQYQDAVRVQIDRLYTAYADVLEARAAVRAAQAGDRGMEELVQMTRRLVEQQQRGQPELTTTLIGQANAQDALQKTEAALLKAQQNLAVLLALPPEEGDCLRIRGSLRERVPPVGGTEELVQQALQVRPDLAAYRMGVTRARADVQLARAEGIDNAFLFYTPYTVVDYAPQGLQSANGWALGTILPVPVFNRNQGNVARACANVTQTQLEQKGLELQVVREVEDAAAELATSRAIVERYQREILADARSLREQKQRLYQQGQAGLDVYLEARKDYNEVVREYLEALARQRRAAFKLNTAVGQRIVP
jgi:cobalt-zinc-cadmium efflux system outer membrane protein